MTDNVEWLKDVALSAERATFWALPSEAGKFRASADELSALRALVDDLVDVADHGPPGKLLQEFGRVVAKAKEIRHV